MQKKTKWLLLLLVAALISLNAKAQDGQSDTYTTALSRELASYISLTKLPFNRILANPPRLTHAQEVMQDNELEPKTVGQDADFSANPLQINSKPLDYDTFDGNTKGVLSVVKGNPAAKDVERIAFYISIRRDGQLVKNKKMAFLGKKLYQINLSDIFPFCNADDRLIITPVNAGDWKAKRILRLVPGC